MVRFKNRYLVLQLTWRDGRAPDGLNDAGLVTALRDSLQAYYGDMALGSGLSSMQVKYYSHQGGLAIVRCDRDASTKVVHAVKQLASIQLRRVAIQVLHIAGGVKTCQRVAEAAMAKLKLPPQVKAAMSEKLALLDI